MLAKLKNLAIIFLALQKVLLRLMPEPLRLKTKVGLAQSSRWIQ